METPGFSPESFIRKVAFILSAAKVEDYELKRTCHYLACQIWQAA
jgi:hypothetical protein